MNKRVGYLKATVNLKDGWNVLKVFLTGKTGAKMRIKIVQQIEACGPTRVSVASDGAQGNGGSTSPSISGDGRFVAFTSAASNLVPGDNNDQTDIFVHDRQTGITEIVSVASDGTQADDGCEGPSISSDGRFVAFFSFAANLVPGDTNGARDIFVHDRRKRETKRVSVASDGLEGGADSRDPVISDDGRLVAFVSWASNLVADDTNPSEAVFVHDRQTGVTEMASVGSDGTQGYAPCNSPAISGDGRFVAFSTEAASLLPGAWFNTDVFVHNRQTRETERVSVGSDGTEGNLWSSGASMSNDGRFVAFMADAPNLVPGDTNDEVDVFVRDRQKGVTERISVASDGTHGNGFSRNPEISSDGRFVVFWSFASNLVAGDTNGFWDIFVHDRQRGITERVNIAFDGTQDNSGSEDPSISHDGRFLSFFSGASNLVSGDTNSAEDVFIAFNPLSQYKRQWSRER